MSPEWLPRSAAHAAIRREFASGIEVMTGRPGVRGQLNSVMNQLVRDGVITSFRTNFGERGTLDEIVVVVVTAPNKNGRSGISYKVQQALDLLPIDILVCFERT